MNDLQIVRPEENLYGFGYHRKTTGIPENHPNTEQNPGNNINFAPIIKNQY